MHYGACCHTSLIAIPMIPRTHPTIFFHRSLGRQSLFRTEIANCSWERGSVSYLSSLMDHDEELYISHSLNKHVLRSNYVQGYLLLEGGAEFGGQMSQP